MGVTVIWICTISSQRYLGWQWTGVATTVCHHAPYCPGKCNQLLVIKPLCYVYYEILNEEDTDLRVNSD